MLIPDLMTSLGSGGIFDPAGPQASEITRLWWALASMGTVVYLLVLAFIVGGVRRRRDDRGQGGPPQTDGVSKWIVLGGVAMPVAVLAAVFGLSLAANSALPGKPPENAIVIDVIGHQWWWEIRYGEEGLETANEIHIPAGEPVALRLTSADVIHSFWVPQLAGKLDALPDGVNTLVFTADRPSRHEGRCAEFCGLQHTNMGVLAVVEARREFDRWVEAQARPAEIPDSGEAAVGFRLFFQAGCSDCHSIRGTEARGEKGPDLTHVASRSSLAANTLTNTPEHLAHWVGDPQAIKPGAKMRDIELSGEELDALVSFLETLR